MLTRVASARDTPAIPNAGKALLRRLFFEERFDMRAILPAAWAKSALTAINRQLYLPG